MAANPRYQGLKLMGRHHDYLEAARGIIKAAVKSPLVKKIMFGEIKCAHGGKARITIKDNNNESFLTIIVRTTGSIQEIIIQVFNVTQKAAVHKLLEAA